MTDLSKQLEFFSGIGGFRLGLSYAGLKLDVTAVDVNDIANEIYTHNFNEAPVRKNITTITPKWLEKANCGIWTMSPPCQPFTRQGLQRDTEDPRSGAFLHLLNLLSTMRETPQVIFLENVKNFEGSESCMMLLDVLQKRGFHWRAFLVSPTQIGFPNQRTRFFLVAKKIDQAFDFPEADPEGGIEVKGLHIWTRFPGVSCDSLVIRGFLQNNTSPELIIPPAKLGKPSARCFDVVGQGSRLTNCVTRSYGKFVEGTGSVLLLPKGRTEHRPEDVLPDKTMVDFVNRLRYFTPIEVCRMMGFKMLGMDKDSDLPIEEKDDIRVVSENFAWLENDYTGDVERARSLWRLDSDHRCLPMDTDSYPCTCEAFTCHGSNQHMWQCLGNSLNPQVVGVIARICGIHKIIEGTQS